MLFHKIPCWYQQVHDIHTHLALIKIIILTNQSMWFSHNNYDIRKSYYIYTHTINHIKILPPLQIASIPWFSHNNYDMRKSYILTPSITFYLHCKLLASHETFVQICGSLIHFKSLLVSTHTTTEEESQKNNWLCSPNSQLTPPPWPQYLLRHCNHHNFSQIPTLSISQVPFIQLKWSCGTLCLYLFSFIQIQVTKPIFDLLLINPIFRI